MLITLHDGKKVIKVAVVAAKATSNVLPCATTPMGGTFIRCVELLCHFAAIVHLFVVVACNGPQKQKTLTMQMTTTTAIGRLRK